jgi:hypothetical protein
VGQGHPSCHRSKSHRAMEPLTAASTFAVIVGLLSNFKAERRGASADEYQEFLAWLDQKRYKSVIDEITSNHLLGLSIKNLLDHNHEQVIQLLEVVNETVSKIASRISGLQEITQAISPQISLSQQAISILTQLEESGGSAFLENKTFGGTNYIIMDGKGGSIDIVEARFADDDLSVLVSLGLLRSDINGKGHRLWRVTREGSKLTAVSHS